MKIAFIGCVEFSKYMLEELLTLTGIDICGIVTRESSAFNADFHSLKYIAETHKIPCLVVERNNQEKIATWLTTKQPDVIYCLGWSYILNSKLLSIPNLGVIGYHPAALPKNRGRHPIIWALALGLEETASTFFFMDQGVDSGDIIDQRFVAIDENDNARTLYDKLIKVAKEQLKEITLRLITGNITRIPQDHSKATYWRKRSKADGLIDWRMSARNIHNLVRALTKPYVGAHCLYKGSEIKIWQTEIVEVHDTKNIIHIEYGKVLESNKDYFIVKCGEGVIKVIDSDFKELPKEGSYL